MIDRRKYKVSRKYRIQLFRSGFVVWPASDWKIIVQWIHPLMGDKLNSNHVDIEGKYCRGNNGHKGAAVKASQYFFSLAISISSFRLKEFD